MRGREKEKRERERDDIKPPEVDSDEAQLLSPAPKRAKLDEALHFLPSDAVCSGVWHSDGRFMGKPAFVQRVRVTLFVSMCSLFFSFFCACHGVHSIQVHPIPGVCCVFLVVLRFLISNPCAQGSLDDAVHAVKQTVKKKAAALFSPDPSLLFLSFRQSALPCRMSSIAQRLSPQGCEIPGSGLF